MTYKIVIEWTGDRPATVLADRTYGQFLELLADIYATAYNEQVVNIHLTRENNVGVSRIPNHSPSSVVSVPGIQTEGTHSTQS